MNRNVKRHKKILISFSTSRWLPISVSRLVLLLYMVQLTLYGGNSTQHLTVVVITLPDFLLSYSYKMPFPVVIVKTQNHNIIQIAIRGIFKTKNVFSVKASFEFEFTTTTTTSIERIKKSLEKRRTFLSWLLFPFIIQLQLSKR